MTLQNFVHYHKRPLQVSRAIHLLNRGRVRVRLHQIKLHTLHNLVHFLLRELVVQSDAFEDVGDDIVGITCHFVEGQVLELILRHLKNLFKHWLNIIHHAHMWCVRAVELSELASLLIRKLTRYTVQLLARAHMHVDGKWHEAFLD